MRDMTAMTVSSVPATPVVGSGDEARTTTAALRVEVLSDWSAVDAIEREWDELAERSDAEISSCPAYARVWWKHYGRGRLAIVVCRAAERIVGVLPMFIQRIGPWPVGVKVARLIGCDSTIAVMSPAIDAAWTTEAVRSTVAELLQHHGCDVVHLGAIQGDTLHADAMRAAGNAAAEASSPRFNVLERSIGVFTRWDLPASFEDYTASLDKSDRSNLKRNLNKVGKAPDSRVRVVTDPAEATKAFDAFVPMHTEQWKGEGKPGHFGDWAGSTAFARELVVELSKRGRVSFVEQDIEGVCVCSYWSYMLGSRAYWRLPARAVGEKWEPYALGRVGLVTMLRELIGMGVKFVDGGPGHYDYKLRLGATEHPLVAFMFTRPSASGRFKATCLAKYADLVHLVYYRAWRLKFAPKLGWKSGTLMRCWVRSRV